MARAWVQYNPNPAGKKTSDCVIRALTKATGSTWQDVYKELSEIGLEMYEPLTADNVWKEYLTRLGFERVGIRIVKGMKRPTADSFTKEHPTGTYVLAQANHLCTAVDGQYFDTFDNGLASVYHYWKKP